MFFDFSLQNIVIWLLLFGALSVVWIIFMPQLMGLQTYFAIRKSRKSLERLKKWADQSRRTALKEITKHGRTRRDVENELDDLLEFFAIEPVSKDPAGVLKRLEHLLDVRKKRFEGAIKKLAPEADSEAGANLEMVVEGAMASYMAYKIVRHLTLLADKSKSMQLAQILQLQMPILEQIAKSYRDATTAFSKGKAIGDGVGAMVAAKFLVDGSYEEGIKDTIYMEAEVEGRKAFVVKAKGPGGRVGKPGELIKKLAEKHDFDRIIMIDAALKLEGEESGRIVEGVGAAIGGPPTEKHKIEELATKKGIPLDAIVIKESFKEAITALHKDISKSVDASVDRIREIIRERTDEDDVVLIAGIGNTIGISQNPSELPTRFPKRKKEKDELESFEFLLTPGGGESLLKYKEA